jgi:hypothetical protein
VSPVPVDPLQSQVAVRSGPVSHVRTSVSLVLAACAGDRVIHQKGWFFKPV